MLNFDFCLHDDLHCFADDMFIAHNFGKVKVKCHFGLTVN